MAVIKPFKGIRPPKDLVEQVESRPYDVLNSEEAREEAKGNEKSLYHIIKPEIDFPEGTSEYDPRVYEKAAQNFQMFQDKGWLVQDEKEQYYIYAQTMNGKTQYGLVVCAYVDDYMTGVIKKHELTRRDKEEDRMKHVRVNNANIEPVFFAYPDNAVLDKLVAKYASSTPVYDFIAPIDGFGHQFWIISDDADISQYIQTNKSSFGRGGMVTKHRIARKVAGEGIEVVITNGKRDGVLLQLVNIDPATGQNIIAPDTLCTRFRPEAHKTSSVKKWIAHSEGFAKGEIHLDGPASEALVDEEAANSVLMVGVTNVIGNFEKDDIVKIFDEKGNQIGVGKTQYSSAEAISMMGKKGEKPIVHYDYLYLL